MRVRRIQTKQTVLLVMHTAAVRGSLAILVVYTMGMSHHVLHKQDVRGNKRLAQVLAMNQLVTAILDAVGQTIRRIARLSTK